MKNTKIYLNSTKEIGNYGEKVVLYYLKTRGFRLLKTNLRLKTGEVDILVAKDKVIYIVEVKSARVYINVGYDKDCDLEVNSSKVLVFKVEPEDSFTRKKIRKLRLLSHELLAQRWTDGFDLEIIGFVVRILVDREGVVQKSVIRRLF